MTKLFSDTEITRLKFDDFIANCLLGYSYKNEKNISDTAAARDVELYLAQGGSLPAFAFSTFWGAPARSSCNGRVTTNDDASYHSRSRFSSKL